MFLNRAFDLDRMRDPRVAHDDVEITGLIADEMLDPATNYPYVGADAHIALKESEATYTVLEGKGGYAPDTFAGWKARYGFPPRLPDESLEDWRARAKVFIYYNVTELGLGRELGCSEFDDGGEKGVACFVTNYGETFGDQPRSAQQAIDGGPVRNTVCIAYIPFLPEDAKVQFFVYGSDGQRQTWAQLDQFGPRPHPFVCTNCHGGTHDPDLHLTRGARFLPAQPSWLSFDAEAPYDLATQEEYVRRVNALAYGEGPDGDGDQKLTAEQRTWLKNLYDHGGGDIHTPGQQMLPHWAPPGWATNRQDTEIWTKIIDPYCSTCHAAIDEVSRVRFDSPDGVMPYVQTTVCGNFSMPNAQITAHRLWRRVPVAIDGQNYDSLADALLDWVGLDRDTCLGLESTTGCLRGGLPNHALCGNDTSGTVCLDTGRCGPDFGSSTRSASDPIGYCTLGGERRCPVDLSCVPSEASLEDGWSGGVCR